jgi:hypothetical protein
MWATILGTLLNGLPQDIALIESLFAKWSSGTPPTQADFDAMRAAASRTARDRLTLQLNAAGVLLTDPVAIKLLAMT